MKAIYLGAVLTILCIQFPNAQNVTLENLEASFLQKNYDLIARKYNIQKADAEIVQEKLWNNPTLSISEVNLWKTYGVETQPNLFGNFGKNQQISAELEQLVELAGKQKKRVAIKELEKNSVLFEYEEVMRVLKKELRQTYYSLAKINEEKMQLQNSIDLFSKMTAQYKRQADLKNVPKADFYRLQTELISLQKDKYLLDKNEIELLSKLRLLTQNPELKAEEIDFSDFTKVLKPIPLNIKELAREQNIDLKRQANDTEIAEKQLILEKAQRIPDLTLQVQYDRGGNIMHDFVGFGLSMDLPIFNTNKGNIKSAQLSVKQEKVYKEKLIYELDNSIDAIQDQLVRLENTLNQWKDLDREGQLKMVENYKKHLHNKDVTILEFIDFSQAYRQSQEAYLELLETYKNTFEELNYIVGLDL